MRRASNLGARNARLASVENARVQVRDLPQRQIRVQNRYNFIHRPFFFAMAIPHLSVVEWYMVKL